MGSTGLDGACSIYQGHLFFQKVAYASICVSECPPSRVAMAPRGTHEEIDLPSDSQVPAVSGRKGMLDVPWFKGNVSLEICLMFPGGLSKWKFSGRL